MPVKVRQAKPSDVAAIKMFDEFGGSRHREATAGTCFVAETEGTVVGYASYEPRGLLGQPLLTYLCVRKEYRKQGIGSALVQAVQSNAQGRVLISSTEDWCVETQRIFERQGWKRIGALSGINKDGSAELFFSIALCEAPRPVHEQ
jgi:GNAT superfamily N-acetyltransferase